MINEMKYMCFDTIVTFFAVDIVYRIANVMFSLRCGLNKFYLDERTPLTFAIDRMLLNNLGKCPLMTVFS